MLVVLLLNISTSTCTITDKYKLKTFEIFCGYPLFEELTSPIANKRMRCASKCSEYDACVAFLPGDESCLLIGYLPLPGNLKFTSNQEVFVKNVGRRCLGGVCYEYEEVAMSWTAAEQVCVNKYGGHLAAVTNCATHNLLMSYLTGKHPSKTFKNLDSKGKYCLLCFYI